MWRSNEGALVFTAALLGPICGLLLAWLSDGCDDTKRAACVEACAKGGATIPKCFEVCR